MRKKILVASPITADFRKDIRKLLKSEASDPKAFTQEQAAAFLDAAKHSRFLSLYQVGFLTGARTGELFALRCDDIQKNGKGGRHLRIERQREARGGKIGPPKTQSSKRDIQIGKDLGLIFDDILAHRRWKPEPWLFVTKRGHMVDPSALNRDFEKCLKAAGLGETGLTPHSMRHSFATWAIDRGENVKWVSQQLGHSDIATTLRIYAKWFTLADQGAAHRAGNGLFGNKLGNRDVA